MKFSLAPSILLLLSIGATTEAASYFSGEDVASIGNSDAAANFCASKGQVLATQVEWCNYAKSNGGVKYGTTYFDDAACSDVEDSCGIPKPTDAPTGAPTPAPTEGMMTVCHGGSSNRTPYTKVVVTQAQAKVHLASNHRTWAKYRDTLPGAEVERWNKKYILDEDCLLVLITAAPAPAAPTPVGLTIKRTSAAVGGMRRKLEVCEVEQDSILCVEAPPVLKSFSAPKKGSGSGDPHFKTWTGDKYDYHGECDLVLVDNPTFADGLGLKLHIRTTHVKYFSYIERVALQIGDDVLEFDNDVENFLINGEKVEANHKHHKTMLAGFVIRRDPKAISVRLNKAGKGTSQDDRAKIDFHTRKNGFPGVIVDGGNTDVFVGSLGLLGEYTSGLKLARDGETEMNDEDATAFALEWQVRGDEPMLFKEARFPQFPNTCTPPKKVLGNRLGNAHAVEEAEKACAHWKEDKEDCVFDVMATRDVLVAEEGHIVNIE